ncbi:MAG TPA: hypothetical protein PKL43_09075, partial [Bacteroidales bacterium]|nr:hypothetical protein [Bacteroidales bacterium]
MKLYKAIWSLILSCIFTASYAHSLDWYYSLSARGGRLWSFEGAVQIEEGGLPLYSETFRPAADILRPELRFPVWEEIKGKDLQAYKSLLDKFPDSLELHINKGIQRKEAVWDLYFYPFLHKNGRYYRLLSFEWAYIREATAGLLNEDGQEDTPHFVSSLQEQPGAESPGQRYAENS